MGNMTILRFIEEFLTIGYRVELEFVGKGIYTEVTITKPIGDGSEYEDLLVQNIPTNHLRDSDKLYDLKALALASIK